MLKQDIPSPSSGKGCTILEVTTIDEDVPGKVYEVTSFKIVEDTLKQITVASPDLITHWYYKYTDGILTSIEANQNGQPALSRFLIDYLPGDIIRASWVHLDNRISYFNDLHLNSNGLPYQIDYYFWAHGGDSGIQRITKIEYAMENVRKITFLNNKDQNGEFEVVEILEYTSYDTMINPFHKLKSFVIDYYNPGFFQYYSKNNPLVIEDGLYTKYFEYQYDRQYPSRIKQYWHPDRPLVYSLDYICNP